MQVEVSVNIAARPAEVWPIMTDVERWPEWTPSATSVTRLEPGPLGPGSTARVKQPGLPHATWEVTAYRPGESFTWEARIRGSKNSATHTVVPDSSGGSAVTLSFEQRGFLAALVSPFTKPLVRRAVRMEAEGLKRRSEAQAAAAA